jgi:hypothetical protein
MKRRTALLGAATAALPLLAPRAWAQAAASADAEPVQRLATAWRLGPAAPAGQPETGHHVGILEVDWPAAEVRMRAAQSVPSRAHAVLAMPDGGFVAVAFRPGRWLLRCDAGGAVVSRRSMDDEQPAQRTFNGHVIASADGQWLFTTETDPRSGLGWVSVRDSRTLARVAQFETGGHDPHDLLLAADGSLLVANGGIVRDDKARKIEPERINPALVQLHPASGHALGRWQLEDRRLSLRHMAWAQGDAPLLGIGLQAEHDAAEQRAEAPVLALWDGQTLALANRDAQRRRLCRRHRRRPRRRFCAERAKGRPGPVVAPGRAAGTDGGGARDRTLCAAALARRTWCARCQHQRRARRGTLARHAGTPHAGLAGATGARQPLGGVAARLRRCRAFSGPAGAAAPGPPPPPGRPTTARPRPARTPRSRLR